MLVCHRMDLLGFGHKRCKATVRVLRPTIGGREVVVHICRKREDGCASVHDCSIICWSVLIQTNVIMCHKAKGNHILAWSCFANTTPLNETLSTSIPQKSLKFSALVRGTYVRGPVYLEWSTPPKVISPFTSLTFYIYQTPPYARFYRVF